MWLFRVLGLLYFVVFCYLVSYHACLYYKMGWLVLCFVAFLHWLGFLVWVGYLAILLAAFRRGIGQFAALGLVLRWLVGFCLRAWVAGFGLCVLVLEF